MHIRCSCKKALESYFHKSVIVISIFFFVSSLLVPIALAETEPTTNIKPIDKTKSSLSPNTKKETGVAGEARVEKLEKVRLHWLTMYERIQKALLQEENLIKRIESRIAKLKSEGKDTTQAERAVVDAKAKLEVIKKDLAALDKKARALETAADQRTHIQTMMQDVKKIKTAIMEVHKLLESTMPQLKGTRPLEATKSAKPLSTGAKKL